MSILPLYDFLRTLRKQSGLTERDAAFLVLGRRSGTVVSRHEKRRRQPSLNAALGYRTLYGTPVEKLFAGRGKRIESDVKGRMRLLEQKLQQESHKAGIESRQVAKKLAWLRHRLQS